MKGAARCAADGTEKDDGAYLKVKCAAQCADVQGHNTVVLRARFRPMGGAWSGRAVLYLLVMTVGNAAGGVIGPLARKVLSR